MPAFDEASKEPAGAAKGIAKASVRAMHSSPTATMNIFCTATGCFGARQKQYPATPNISRGGR